MSMANRFVIHSLARVSTSYSPAVITSRAVVAMA